MSNNLSDPFCYSLDDTPLGAKVLHIVVLSVIVLLSLLANGLVLLLVARYKQLRRRSIMVSLSVVVVDILLTVTFTVPVLVTAAAQDWMFMDGGCVFFGTFSFQFLMTRWLIMAILCIDRFSTVRFPFSYKKYSKKILLVLTFLAWLIPLVVSLPVLSQSGFGITELRDNMPTCFLGCDQDDNICKLFYLFYFTSIFILGSAVPIGVYSWMYYRARRLRPTMVLLGQVSTQVASGAIVRQPVAQHEQLPSRERRALVTFVLIMVTVLVTGLPAYLNQIVRALNFDLHCRIPIYVHYIIIELLLSASALDPFVIIRTKDFRTCIKLLFCRRMAHTEDISNPNSNSQQLNHLYNLHKSASNESQALNLGGEAHDTTTVTVVSIGPLANGEVPLHKTIDHSTPRPSLT